MTDRIHGESAGPIDYIAVEESPKFQALKRTQRSFIFPLAALFLIWYFVYVLLAAFAPEFMAQRVWGDITIGLLFGLGQFVSTFAITMAYVAFANKRLDPVASEIREELEKAQAQA
ncbi:DUF485 domain-containing protein [Microbacterium sp. GXF0217]